jgi:Zn-finger protein
MYGDKMSIASLYNTGDTVHVRNHECCWCPSGIYKVIEIRRRYLVQISDEEEVWECCDACTLILPKKKIKKRENWTYKTTTTEDLFT